MGLAEALLGRDNPFAQWTGDNRNYLAAIASGLGSGQNIQAGLGNALQMMPQAGQLDLQAREKRKADQLAETQANATTAWLRANYPQYADLPPAEGFNLAMLAEQQKYKTPPGGGGVNYGLTPIWGTDANGKTGFGLPGDDGSFKLVDTNGFVPLNPYDLNAQKAAGTGFGKGVGDAQLSVGQAQKELDQSLAAINGLNAEDVLAGKQDWFNQLGALPRGMWLQGGTNIAKFKNVADNIIDRSWLSARAMLKGSGPITDYESAKAENAVSMMKSALQSGDKASYEAAVAEYEYWIKQGFAKIQQQAASIQGYGYTGNPPPPAPGSAGGGNSGDGWTVVGVE